MKTKNKKKKRRLKNIVAVFLLVALIFPSNSMAYFGHLDLVPLEMDSIGGWGEGDVPWFFAEGVIDGAMSGVSELTGGLTGSFGGGGGGGGGGIDLAGGFGGAFEGLFGGEMSLESPSFADLADNIGKMIHMPLNFGDWLHKKQQIPEVAIYIDNPNIKEGDWVTARAVTRGFVDQDDLYYTWSLLRDGSTDIDEGKKVAMGMIARGEFDPELFEIDYTEETDDDGFFATIGGTRGVGAQEGEDAGGEGPVPLLEDSEGNEYKFWWMEDSEKISRCYKFNLHKGEFHTKECKHEFYDCDGETGDGEFNLEEEKCWETDPTSNNTDAYGVGGLTDSGDEQIDEADVSGWRQDSLTWKYKEGDRVGVVVEGTSELPIIESKLSNYYRIMWAYMGVCDETKYDLFSHDDCDDEEDLGFPYFETVPVAQAGKEKMHVELEMTPEKPLINTVDADFTDTVIVEAKIKNDIPPDKIHYKWRVIDGDEVEYGDELLKDYQEGFGLSKVFFKPEESLLGGANMKDFEVIVLATYREAGEPEVSLGKAKALLTVKKTDLKVKIRKAEPSGDDSWTPGEIICEEGLLIPLCPLVPNMAYFAEVEGDVGEELNWFLNGEQVIGKSLIRAGGAASKSLLFPITAAENTINQISVSGKTGEGLMVNAGRLFFPMTPRMIFDAGDGAVESFLATGRAASNFFGGEIGGEVTLNGKIFPPHAEVEVDWIWQGEKIDAEMLGSIPGIPISGINGNAITFDLSKNIKPGQMLAPTVNVRTIFDEDHFKPLNNNFGISTPNLISSVTPNISAMGSFSGIFAENEVGVKQYLASTAENAPMYIVFAIKLALAIVLLWSVLFGFSYVVRF